MARTPRGCRRLLINKLKLPTPSLGWTIDNQHLTHTFCGGAVIRDGPHISRLPSTARRVLVQELQMFPDLPPDPLTPGDANRRRDYSPVLSKYLLSNIASIASFPSKSESLVEMPISEER